MEQKRDAKIFKLERQVNIYRKEIDDMKLINSSLKSRVEPLKARIVDLESSV